MNRFINLLFSNKTDVYTHRTNDSAKVERDRTTTRDAIRSRYCRRLEQKAHDRGTLCSCGCILQKPREETETGKSSQSTRSTQEPTSTSKLKLSLSLFFYSIIYNPSIWQSIALFEISTIDEMIIYNNHNLSVIIQTTQSLLSLGGIG